MDAILRLVLDTQTLLKQLSDVVREWVQSTSRMNRAAEGVDFDLAQREAKELENVVRQMAAGVVGNLAKVEAAGKKLAAQGLDPNSKAAKQVEIAIARLSATADRELGKLERAARRVELQRLRKEAKDAEDAIKRMTREADRELRKVEKAADRIQFRKAREEAKAVEQSIRTLQQSGVRSFAALEARAKAAGLSLQTGIGGALTRLPPQVQSLQRRFEASLAAMRTAADRVSFQKAQAETQRLEAAIHRMGLAAQRDLDRVRQSTRELDRGFTSLGGVVGRLNRVLGALGIFLSARSLLNFARDAVSASIQLEAFQAQLRASVNTIDEANDLFQFANDQTERLGLNFASVVEGTARFSAATKGSNLTLAQRKDILLAVFEASRVLNLSEQRLQNTLLALEQIASKATVSMEELRRQLGDNIPGAVRILAQQMGVTQERLLKMIETNQVLSEDALPLLAKGLRETFGQGTQEAINTTAAAVGRLQKQLFDLKVAFSEGFGKELKSSIDGISESMSSMESAAQATGAVVASIISAFSSLIDLRNTVTDFFTRIIVGSRDAERGQEGLLKINKELDDQLAQQDLTQKGLSESVKLFLATLSTLQQEGELYGDRLEDIKDRAEEVIVRHQLAGEELPASFKRAAIAVGLYADEMEKALKDRAFALLDELSKRSDESAISAEDLEKIIASFPGTVELLAKSLGLTVDELRKMAEEGDLLAKDILPAVEDAAVAAFGPQVLSGVRQVARALEEAADRAKSVRDEFFGTEKAADELANKLRDLVHGLDLENLTAAQAEAIRELIEDVKEALDLLGREVPPDIDVIIDKLDALGHGIFGVREEIEKLTDELREGLEGLDLENLNPQQLDNLKEKIQEVLDAWAEYGEEVPADIQAVADQLGVTTTAIEKELEKQEKAAEKAARAEEQASKRRVDALEKIADAYRKLFDQISDGPDTQEIDNLESKLDDLRRQEFEFVGDPDDLVAIQEEIQEVEAQLASLRESQTATGESAKEMANRVDDAIRGLIEGLEPVYARLDEGQRLAVQNIIEGLHNAGQAGQASGEVIADSLQQMIDVLESAGQPTADLRSTLNELETGTLDVGAAFRALEEEIEKSYQEIDKGAEGVEAANKKLERDVEKHIQLLGKLNRTHESTFNDINKRMEIGLTIWEKWIEACERLKDCLSGAG